MSKIGRKPIDIGSAKVEVKGHEVHYSGKKGSGTFILPSEMSAHLDGKKLALSFDKKDVPTAQANRIWGLNRALLANKINGCQQEFEKVIQITGLGFKAAVSGTKVVFSLGFSHKIDFVLPKDVSLEVDKTGQRLTFRSPDKQLLGLTCSQVRALRPPEPYKGTGIKLETEIIARKAGKTKAAA
jgi:large subunit ribosomal protein L6